MSALGEIKTVGSVWPIKPPDRAGARRRSPGKRGQARARRDDPAPEAKAVDEGAAPAATTRPGHFDDYA